MYVHELDQLKTVRRNLTIHLAHQKFHSSQKNKHEFSLQFLRMHFITEVAQIISRGLEWAISLKTNESEFFMVKKPTLRLDFEMYGDTKLHVKSDFVNITLPQTLEIGSFYKWAKEVGKPRLEYLPNVLENIVHDYATPTIEEGMEHLARKYNVHKKANKKRNKAKRIFIFSCFLLNKGQQQKNCSMKNKNIREDKKDRRRRSTE